MSMVTICILTYTIFWLLIRNRSILNDATSRLVLRTVSVVVGIVSVCWELATVVTYASEFLFDGTKLTIVTLYFGILINISCVVNYFVYYALR
ncbi:hypothetical protein FO519_010044 [Halicephalobus sp. NKZ332]|nr:hypothetical protein FO519_010044 [Halicephalobus sp. NKZ332]